MILEVAVLNVRMGSEAAYEAAFQQASSIISAMPGYISHQLQRCIEVPNRYLLLVNWESLERWDSLLRSGERVVAVGGSDVHSIPPAEPRHPHGLANPTTWVYAEPTEASILDGIRGGHAFLTDAANDTRLVLTADADGDGRFETLMGDTISPHDGRPVRIRVEVNGGMNRRLWLIADGVPIDIRPLDRVESTHDSEIDISGRRYVRAELRGHRGRPERGEVIWAMTNPIWVNA